MPEQKIEQKIEKITNRQVSAIRPLSGGCVGDVYRVVMQSGPDLVAKVGDGQSGLAVEGASLEYLKNLSDLPVPEVLFSDDNL
ncbi:MAG: fructosamine kinase, partial [Rhodospirillaceae bacterium]|nr:fructosamine kinase [Rhodospirillaceae bacterium]